MDSSLRNLERAFATDHSHGPALLREYDRAGTESRMVRALRASLGASPRFVSLLTESERSNYHRMTTGLTFGASDVTISIQAGPGHYCSNRNEVLPYAAYTEFEIGFQRSLLGGGDVEDGIGACEAHAGIGSYWESPDADWTVAGYVPTTLVQALVDHLYIEHGTPRPSNEEPTLDAQAESWLALGQ